MIDDKRIRQVCARCLDLKGFNAPGQKDRARIRDIMNGGARAIQALIPGSSQESAPYANLMLSAGERLAQKLGRPPTIRKEPPQTNDTDRARKHAEKIARIVTSCDDVAKLPMLLPQVGRWLPGYGFSPVVIRHGKSIDGAPYPIIELRDPFEAYPAEWGVGQQPTDIAFVRVMSRRTLIEMYPEHASKIDPQHKASGGVLLDNTRTRSDRAGWSSQSGGGVEVYEYYDRSGCWWVLPEANLLLSHVPNLMKRPQFYVGKRFAFDQLGGQFDHIIGLMAAMARMNLLLIIATEDSVLAETNIYGETLQGDHYNKGRDSVNWLSPGTRVEKPNSQVPFQVFQQISSLERQLRIVAGYPVTDDSLSPNSFVTGRGLEELTASNDLHVREYQLAIADLLQEVDAMRLEWIETYYKHRTEPIPMSGVRQGAAFAETFKPTEIRGDYRTRRVYGAMAGFDEPAKIATGLQLLAAEIIDDVTMAENVDGLEDISKIQERIRNKKDESLLDEVLSQMAVQGDQRVLEIKIREMPDGDRKRMYEEVFLSQPAQQEEPMAPPAFEPPEDTFTALARMGTTSAGGPNATLSTQTIQAA